MSRKSTFKKLEENNGDVYKEVFDILLKVLDNVIKAPENIKYRKLRLSNEIVSNKLIPAIGALECLFDFGFQEADEFLELPQTIPLEEIQKIRQEFYECHVEYVATCNRTSTAVALKKVILFEEIRSISKLVLLYENKDLQATARSIIPLDNLKSQCSKMRRGKDKFAEEFALVFELMRWFKYDFFKWMNSPECEKCKCSSTFKGFSQRPEDLVKANRVEEYTCPKCQDRLIFPRYNDPAILLITRTGRCGEWANCFCLLCRSLGYETRFILDKTDHVWVEIFSKSLSRWIHCDPCENTLDKPLMYEKGWNKKLSYVIAISCEEIQDVTWRYTTDFDKVRARRKLCREEDLIIFMLKFSNELQTSLPQERKSYLAKRRLYECIEMLAPPQADGEYDGRTSGSLEWRLNRNECKETPQKFIWEPNEVEIRNKIFSLKYYSSKNKYLRTESLDVVEGWENGVFEVKSIFRKVEFDWKQCYLSRTEGSKDGTIQWRFSSKKVNLRIDYVIVSYHSTVFHSGQIRWLLCNDETCVPLKTSKLMLLYN
ncbi:hypothetical protein V9T40_012344 [Parthenolecanium corni]|uniref:Peptide-N(4)-(N-acetyl-beta-glucosaminyl)asparagine amidase n=1 Tax=Parthenolecanium corni TaxID=536013 RepID=A0AAN9T753_9HEMI